MKSFIAIALCCLGSLASLTAGAQETPLAMGIPEGADGSVLPAVVHFDPQPDAGGGAVAGLPAGLPAGPAEGTLRLEEKSPSGAFLYSFLGTLLPVGIGTSTSLGKNEVTAGVLVALGGGIIGPSMGHWYANRPDRALRGILIRAAATGAGWAALESADSQRGKATAQAVVFAGSALIGAVSFVADIAGAPGSARAHNREVAAHGATASPFVGSVEGAPGAGVRVAY